MAPPVDIPKVPGLGLPPPPPAAPAPPATAPGGHSPPVPLPPALDLADIRPLDVQGGLQILIAEVRAALEEALLQGPGTPGSAPAPGASGGDPHAAGAPPLLALPPDALAAGAAPEAARQLVELLLRALPPDSADEAGLAQRLPALELAMQSAGARALALIGAWRDVPVTTQAAAHLAVQLSANALGEEVLQAAWLRPEWAGFLPRLEHFRRRRRRLRRRLEDPDYAQGRPEEDERR